jgi:hypothetical protein
MVETGDNLPTFVNLLACRYGCTMETKTAEVQLRFERMGELLREK